MGQTWQKSSQRQKHGIQLSSLQRRKASPTNQQQAEEAGKVWVHPRRCQQDSEPGEETKTSMQSNKSAISNKQRQDNSSILSLFSLSAGWGISPCRSSQSLWRRCSPTQERLSRGTCTTASLKLHNQIEPQAAHRQTHTHSGGAASLARQEAAPCPKGPLRAKQEGRDTKLLQLSAAAPQTASPLPGVFGYICCLCQGKGMSKSRKTPLWYLVR